MFNKKEKPEPSRNPFPEGNFNTTLPQPTKKDSSMPAFAHKRPTTCTIYFVDGTQDQFTCSYAKAVAGALQISFKTDASNLHHFRYIPFSRPDILYIDVESESENDGDKKDRYPHEH